MGEERELYESESRQTIPDVIEFLQQLSHWLASGKLAFPKGDETVVIEVPHNVVLEIEIEEEDEGDNQIKRSIEIEIEWIEDKATATVVKSVESSKDDGEAGDQGESLPVKKPAAIEAETVSEESE